MIEINKIYNEDCMDTMNKYPIEEIQKIIQNHWSEMMSELEEYVDTEYITLDMVLRYEFFDEGFEIKFN